MLKRKVPDINPFEDRFVIWSHEKDNINQICNQLILMWLKPLEFQTFIAVHAMNSNKKLITDVQLIHLFQLWLVDKGQENIDPDHITDFDRVVKRVGEIQEEIYNSRILLPGYPYILIDRILLGIYCKNVWLHKKLSSWLRWRKAMDLYLCYFRSKTNSLEITKGKDLLYILDIKGYLRNSSDLRYWPQKLMLKVRCNEHKKVYILRAKDHYKRFGGCYSCKEDAKETCVLCGYRGLKLLTFGHMVRDCHIIGEKNFIWLFSDKKIYDNLIYIIYQYTTSFVCAKLSKDKNFSFLKLFNLN